MNVDHFIVEILERKDLYFSDMKQNFLVLNVHPQLLNIIEVHVSLVIVKENYINPLHEPMVKCVLTYFNYVYLVFIT